VDAVVLDTDGNSFIQTVDAVVQAIRAVELRLAGGRRPAIEGAVDAR
jgi:hypothetical protein